MNLERCQQYSWWLVMVLVVCCCTGSVVSADSSGASESKNEGDPQSFNADAKPFLAKYCVACHGSEKQKSRIRFDQLTRYRLDDGQLWTNAHEMLTAGEMPPEDKPQPSADEKKKFLAWIESEQLALRAGTTRRLNRRELSAALRDVTGLSVDYSLSLPEDGKTAGFDTGAGGLQAAPDSVAQVMAVTRRAVDGIRFLESADGIVWSVDLREGKDPRRTFDDLKKQNNLYVKARGYGQKGVGLLLEPKWLGERGGSSVGVPVGDKPTGLLRVRLVVWVLKPYPEIPNPHFQLEVGNRDFEYIEITGTSEKPQTLEFQVQTDGLVIDKRGLTVTFNSRVELPYAIKGFENDTRLKPGETIPGGPTTFRPKFDRKQVPVEKHPVPFLVLQQVEIEMGYVASWPPQEWDANVKVSDDLDSAERLLALWMDRAWRRPASTKERAHFLAFYKKLRGQGMAFDDALRATFQSVLLSANFRYLTSPGRNGASHGQYALASRLSFMLHGMPPDKQLRNLAAQGKLRDPAVLDAQVDRLLADPKSEHFWNPFVTQWLEMGQPITLVMRSLKNQDFRFGRYLKESMRDETIGYIQKLFTDNRPARELLVSDWTLMNESLANHYGYDGIKGGELRKVTLRRDDPRGGGVLGHAGIQSMLCWMGDNWVIYRGAWTLRHILDDPPPPPPLEVPELDPSAGDNRGKSFKQLLVQHQANPNCAVCHKDMDPLGFAFQNFDISGRWRDVEHEKYERNELDGKIEWKGTGKTRPVDAEGRLPRGETFKSFSEARELMAKHYRGDMVRGILKNMVIYGTGRRPDVHDMTQIRSIIKKHEAKGLPLGDVMKALIRSRVFVER